MVSFQRRWAGCYQARRPHSSRWFHPNRNHTVAVPVVLAPVHLPCPSRFSPLPAMVLMVQLNIRRLLEDAGHPGMSILTEKVGRQRPVGHDRPKCWAKKGKGDKSPR